MIDLRSFIESIEENREHFRKVKREVDPVFEATGVLEKLQFENKYPAVLYEKVKGHNIPVLSNLFADRGRIALAFGTTEPELNRVIREREGGTIDPIVVDNAPVQEMVSRGSEVDLGSLPVLTHCKGEGGQYITAGLLVSKDPETGSRNVGIYRHMVQGKNQIGICLSPTSHGKLIYDKWMDRNERMPVAIAIGHHPLVYLGAMSFVNYGADEYAIIGAYMQEALRLARCKTVDLEVPADAEIVLEGYIEPGALAIEGPVAEYTTVYGPPCQNPYITVTAITQRKNPIYLDCFNGHIDHMLLGGTARLSSIYRAVGKACPTVQDVFMPPSGCCRFSCYISIKKRHEGEAKNVICAAMGADPYIKLCVVVDEDVDIFNESAMLLAVNTRLRPTGNVIVIPNAKTNLDPTVDNMMLVTKVGIDATKPLHGYPENVSVPNSAEIDLNKYLEG